jgi:hypothetical protein
MERVLNWNILFLVGKLTDKENETSEIFCNETSEIFCFQITSNRWQLKHVG